MLIDSWLAGTGFRPILPVGPYRVVWGIKKWSTAGGRVVSGTISPSRSDHGVG